MIKIRGNIRVTENMENLLKHISNSKNQSLSYWRIYDRLVDAIVISIFYGLYKSRKLPPLDIENVSLKKTYEFNVDITDFASIIQHYLFCLYLSKNDLPLNVEDLLLYRKNLYKFIEKIIDPEYFKNVLIPFYINEADKVENDDISFIYKLWNSDNIKLETSTMSPEYIAREFTIFQNDFYEDIIKNTHKNMFEPD